LLGFTKARNDLFTEIITSNGGTVAKDFEDKATFVVCNKDKLGENEKVLEKAEAAKIPIISDKFLLEIDESSEMPDHNKFILRGSDSKSENPKKRKLDESGKDSDDKPAKKTKDGEDSAEKKSEEDKDKKDKDQENEKKDKEKEKKDKEKEKKDKEKEKKGDDGNEKLLKRAETIKKMQERKELPGELRHRYNFEMQLHKRSPKGEIGGIICWLNPSLENGTTKFKGNMTGDSVTFKEYKILSGEGVVGVPNEYSGKFVANKRADGSIEYRIEGTVKDFNGDTGPFHITLA